MYYRVAIQVDSAPTWQKRRLELELGTGGDHDVPYTFALPPSMPQVLAWMRLLARVQRRQKQQSREDCISVGDFV